VIPHAKFRSGIKRFRVLDFVHSRLVGRLERNITFTRPRATLSSRLVDERATLEAPFLRSYLTNSPTARGLIGHEMYPSVTAGSMGGMGF
jgi:hypothetical protein